MAKVPKPAVELPLVLVEWLDAASADSGWKTLKSIRKQAPCLVRSVGYLVSDEPNFVTLVSSHIPDFDHVDGDVVIPRGMIKRGPVQLKEVA